MQLFPNLEGGEGGLERLGWFPKFNRLLVLMASLSSQAKGFGLLVSVTVVSVVKIFLIVKEPTLLSIIRIISDPQLAFGHLMEMPGSS